ncbi:AbrB/MazE/SpoVT family DNA-binding domain-containing protein [Cupriavidus sp. KK10]|uniref:AbrB/MazE/SpoVT family DNA-binding domain-containing protein n=1 Tax=Cupriavidus sp. KK10 TaxID=1478019 RepID=UPI001BAB0D02|nr:AbrB/MazE/SpoVT family DNA-binding domain-containing protein [Cupriavidus sp. KK10]QUN27741.1 AbrB/MazE/SpoVT family DNA-binding domain-containing protein [Cupriavidus sp. KK10]
MILQIAMWGSSFALRIPTEFVHSMGISRKAIGCKRTLTVDDGISIRALKMDHGAFAHELDTTPESTE